jgi:hypothetical protein
MRNPKTRRSTLALRLLNSFNDWKQCKSRRPELICGLIYAARAVYAVENGWRNVPEIGARKRREKLPNKAYQLKYLTVWMLYKDCNVGSKKRPEILWQEMGDVWPEVEKLYNELLHEGAERATEIDWRPTETIPEDHHTL